MYSERVTEDEAERRVVFHRRLVWQQLNDGVPVRIPAAKHRGSNDRGKATARLGKEKRPFYRFPGRNGSVLRVPGMTIN
jgi:hypothetical protein